MSEINDVTWTILVWKFGLISEIKKNRNEHTVAPIAKETACFGWNLKTQKLL